MIDYKNIEYAKTSIIQRFKIMGNYILLAWHRLFNSSRTFTLKGRKYQYFPHIYNTAWKNERAVEIPIVWNIVQACAGKNILEVGNVLSHYYPVSHTIIDLYEKARGVINKDVTEYCTGRPYDLIVAISTLEHVGWDDDSRDPSKVFRAMDNLTKCLAPGGMLVATIPIGYNREIDTYLIQEKLRFDEMLCLKRITSGNEWVETNWKEIQSIKFNYPFRAANGLVIGIINKPRS